MKKVTDAAEWESLVSRSFVPLRVRSIDRDFAGSVHSVRCGPQTVVHRVRSAATHLARASIDDASPPGVLLYVQRRGYGQVDQFGRSAQHGPGDAVAYLTDRPYELRFPNRGDGVVIHVPLERLTPTRADVEALTARTLSARTGIRALTAYTREILDGQPDASDLNDTVVYLVDAMFSALRDHHVETPDGAIRARFERYVHARAADPRLTAAVVARALAVSPRRLYAAFEAHDDSPAGIIRRRRIAIARAALATSDDPVSDIALRSGFSDVSTFHRAFKADAGISPRTFRTEAMARRAHELRTAPQTATA